MQGFDPQAYIEYATTMANLEAVKTKQSKVADALEEQRQLENHLAITAAKIVELEKALKVERVKLVEAATNAAKNRQRVVNLMFNVTPEKLQEESPNGEGPKGPLWT